jgi:hypothetical protein
VIIRSSPTLEAEIAQIKQARHVADLHALFYENPWGYLMNCRKRMKGRGASKQVHKNPSKEGNPVAKYGDKTLMERHQMKYEPGPKSGHAIDWKK